MRNIFKKLNILIIFLFFFSFPTIAKENISDNQNDVLYSQEYFDYLIECASVAHEELQEEKKQKENEIGLTESQETELTLDNNEPFKLKIESFDVQSYKETVKKEDTKTTIKVNKKFGFIYNTSKTKNKYNSNDYRITSGVEYTPYNKFSLASGLETNYRGQDQNPISKKLYITPTLKFNNNFSVSFINKLNTMDKSSDHDISFNFAPFKSQVADFNVYTGLTRNNSGTTSQSVSFSTNFYF